MRAAWQFRVDLGQAWTSTQYPGGPAIKGLGRSEGQGECEIVFDLAMDTWATLLVQTIRLGPGLLSRHGAACFVHRYHGGVDITTRCTTRSREDHTRDIENRRRSVQKSISFSW
jgi:hypothetical protein